MIVEMFVKGSNFEKHVFTHHDIKKIDNSFDSDRIVLVHDNDEFEILGEVELKVTI